ncbi:XrtA/PEP-CTERM system TPR-repeat protein PrsT [Pseudocolwellia sp. HL-MZ19]|uniref:XrtA/PEP-CTERM system TPR-repeat protein PrsT n=1 Tax=unclassified Pseudocolwellia TaxID=2848178 RepID=UPI003CF54204
MKLAKIFVGIGIISTLAACGESETAITHIEKAKSFKASEIDLKLIALKNAVQLEPKNAEARYLLGETYLAQGFGVGAVKELEKAYSFKYDKNEVIPSLARAYILTTSDEDVIDLDKDSSELSDESKVHFLAYKVLADIRTNNIEQAEKDIKLAEQLLPNNAYVLLANGYLKMAQGEFDTAKGSVNKALTILPEQVDAILLLAQVNTALREHSEATPLYLRYAKLQPKSSIVVLLLAQSLLQEKKFLEAERYADSILAAAPSQPLAHYIKAMSQFELKNYQKALEHSEAALKAQFNQAQLKLIAGVSAYFLGNYEISYSHLEDIVKFLVPEHPARKMFAVSQLQLGMVDDISETLEGFNSTTKEDEKFLSSLSYQLAELGAFENAKEVAKQAMSETPESAEQNMRDGILKLMLNDPSGLQNLKEAVALKPDLLGAELALAYAAIQSKDYDQAIAISNQWKKKYPDKPGSYNILAAVYLKQGLPQQAKAALNKSLEISQKNAFALLELTNLAMLENDKDEAKRLSSIAVQEFPNNPNILRQYFSIHNNDEAFERIKELYKSDENNVAIGMLYTELLIKGKKFTEAINVIDAYETSVKTPKKLWQLKVISHSGLNNVHKAQSILEDWMRINPYHVEPIILLADYYSRNKDVDTALNLVEKALRNQHANNNMLKMGKMQLLIDKGSVREAKSYFEEIKTLGIKKFVAQGIEGKIALLDKNYNKAVELLSAFYQAQPTSKNAILLSSALQGDNKKIQAIKHLETYLEKNKSDQNVRAVLANMYISGQPEKAIKAYKDILEYFPNNVLVLNNVAWLSMEQGNLSEALSFSEHALSVAPKVVNVIDTYAMILLKLDKKSEALSHLVKAYELSEGKNNEVTLNYAEALITNSRLKKAAQILSLIKNTTPSEEKRKTTLQSKL